MGLGDLEDALDGARSGAGGADGAGGVSEELGYGYDNRDPLGKRGRFFDPRDLKVLAEIIALNGLDESSSVFDYDDGDGVLDPTELGYQVWCDGRLRELGLGPTPTSTFGYVVHELPESISELTFVREMRVSASQLQAIPPNIADMPALEKLEAFGNGITEVPEDLGVSLRLRELNLNGNQIAAIPGGVLDNPNLEALFVSGNPLSEVPPMVERLMEKMSRGEKVNVVPPARRFGRNCVPGTAS